MPSRHKSRSVALQGLYQKELVNEDLKEILTFRWYDKKLDKDEKEFAVELICGVIENQELLDTIIKKFVINREFSRISIINRCILRIAVFSIEFQKDIPKQVVIDEALEMTREFESESSVQFNNGVLDSYLKNTKMDG